MMLEVPLRYVMLSGAKHLGLHEGDSHCTGVQRKCRRWKPVLSEVEGNASSSHRPEAVSLRENDMNERPIMKLENNEWQIF